MCDHQFIEIKEITTGSGNIFNNGKLVVCALCGEIRNVWDNGTIEIIGKYNDQGKRDK